MQCHQCPCLMFRLGLAAHWSSGPWQISCLYQANWINGSRQIRDINGYQWNSMEFNGYIVEHRTRHPMAPDGTRITGLWPIAHQVQSAHVMSVMSVMSVAPCRNSTVGSCRSSNPKLPRAYPILRSSSNVAGGPNPPNQKNSGVKLSKRSRF